LDQRRADRRIRLGVVFDAWCGACAQIILFLGALSNIDPDDRPLDRLR
jgi:hypothetical protein